MNPWLEVCRRQCQNNQADAATLPADRRLRRVSSLAGILTIVIPTLHMQGKHPAGIQEGVWYMNKLLCLITAAVLLCPGQAFALTATTVKNSIACLSKEALHEMTQFQISKDKDSFFAYIEKGKCVVMGDGLDVTVTEPPGMFGATSGFIYKGIKFWTTREGLKNYRAE